MWLGGDANISPELWGLGNLCPLLSPPAALFGLSSHIHVPHMHNLEFNQQHEVNIYANFSDLFSVVSSLQGPALTIPDVLKSPKSNIHFFYPLTFSYIQPYSSFCLFNLLRNNLEISPRQKTSMNGKFTSWASLLSRITALYCPFFNIWKQLQFFFLQY